MILFATAVVLLVANCEKAESHSGRFYLILVLGATQCCAENTLKNKHSGL